MYKIVFTKEAARAIQRSPQDVARLIREKLAEIATDPFAPHPNATKLQGHPGYRLRVGDWRAIYDVQQTELVVIVLKIARRGEV